MFCGGHGPVFRLAVIGEWWSLVCLPYKQSRFNLHAGMLLVCFQGNNSLFLSFLFLCSF